MAVAHLQAAAAVREALGAVLEVATEVVVGAVGVAVGVAVVEAAEAAAVVEAAEAVVVTAARRRNRQALTLRRGHRGFVCPTARSWKRRRSLSLPASPFPPAASIW